MILCECGEFVDNDKFKDYIPTSSNPSTPTIGHEKCGLIFDFIDGDVPKRYSSRIELKGIAMRYADKKKFDQITTGKFLLEVDRLKSRGTLSDGDILIAATKSIESNKSLIIDINKISQLESGSNSQEDKIGNI